MTERKTILASPNRTRRRVLLWLLPSLFFFLFLAASTSATSSSFSSSVASAQTKGDLKSLEQATKTLLLHTRQGASHKISVEVATTPAQQSRGLMFRTRLPAKHGMLFLHDPPQKVVMWMKNTYLPLDMIFLDREGKVVQIVERTTPLSLARIRSSQPIAAVLELAAGSVRSLSLAKGDRAEHPFFKR